MMVLALWALWLIVVEVYIEDVNGVKTAQQ